MYYTYHYSSFPPHFKIKAKDNKVLIPACVYFPESVKHTMFCSQETFNQAQGCRNVWKSRGAELVVFKYFSKEKVKIWWRGDCPSISDGPGAKTKQAQSSSTVALANMPLFFFFWPTKHYTFIHCCDFVLCTQFLWVMSLRRKKSSDAKLLPNVLTTFAMKEKVKIAFLCVGLYHVVFSNNLSLLSASKPKCNFGHWLKLP